MPDISPYTATLGRRLAAHLLRRTTYGSTKALIDAYATKTVAQAVNELLTFAPITTKPIDPVTNTTWVDSAAAPVTTSDINALRAYVIGWYIDVMRTDNTVRSKMMFFLHQNWVVSDDAWSSQELYDHIKLLEYYALGSYKNLAIKMCRDLRMMVYLNGYQNSAAAPNENYAREVLELFTIGKGPQIAAGNYTNYTENDIKEAAKVFTGYYYDLNDAVRDPDTGLRRSSASTWGDHHSGNKVFSGAFQNTTITGGSTEAAMTSELQQFMNMVFNQTATAKNICRKLYRYFVHKNITAAVEADIITPLATTLKNSNYDLKVALSQLLQSKHFYDMDDANSTDNKIGAIVKNPLELVLGTCRHFSISPFAMPGATPYTVWDDFYKEAVKYVFCANADMKIFSTTTVAGYPALYLAPKYDRHWFDNSSITQRYYLGKCLLENKCHPYDTWRSFGAVIDIVLWVRNNIAAPSNAGALVDELVNNLYAEIPTTARRSYFLNDILLGTLQPSEWATEWNNYINTGNTNVVKPRLEKLYKTILYAHEMQVQ